MASPSKSPKQPKISETTQDMISSMPTKVTDKIMKRLPIKIAAKMSLLSRKWRRNWLSHRYLVFDRDFLDGQHRNGAYDWHKINNIISNILFYHHGPLQVFHFDFPSEIIEAREIFNHSPWLSFLSRVGVKKIYICNWSGLTIRSHIYACKDLVKLKMEYNVLVPPPCYIAQPLNQTFNHLYRLCLTELDLSDFDAFCFTFSMLQSCPFIEHLGIALSPNKSIVEHKYDYTENYKLEHLLKVIIRGITGSSAEFQLIEFVLATSVVLEKLLFKCANLVPSSELKVSRKLLQLPRASAKAKLVCLEQ